MGWCGGVGTTFFVIISLTPLGQKSFLGRKKRAARPPPPLVWLAATSAAP